MDRLVRQGLKAAQVLQAGQEHLDLLGSKGSKVSLVQEDILDMLAIWYTTTEIYCLHKFGDGLSLSFQWIPKWNGTVSKAEPLCAMSCFVRTTALIRLKD